MLELALWLKRNGFRADQVQAFLPSPMATATAMYHTGKNPLRKRHARRRKTCTIPEGPQACAGCTRRSCAITTPNNWPMLREALQRMGRADLIGNGKHQLVPRFQPKGTGKAMHPRVGAVKASRSGRSTRRVERVLQRVAHDNARDAAGPGRPLREAFANVVSRSRRPRSRTARRRIGPAPLLGPPPRGSPCHGASESAGRT